MSIFSDYKHGALSDEEFEMECIAYNRRARAEEAEWEREHLVMEEREEE